MLLTSRCYSYLLVGTSWRFRLFSLKEITTSVGGPPAAGPFCKREGVGKSDKHQTERKSFTGSFVLKRIICSFVIFMMLLDFV